MSEDLRHQWSKWQRRGLQRGPPTLESIRRQHPPRRNIHSSRRPRAFPLAVNKDVGVIVENIRPFRWARLKLLHQYLQTKCLTVKFSTISFTNNFPGTWTWTVTYNSEKRKSPRNRHLWMHYTLCNKHPRKPVVRYVATILTNRNITFFSIPWMAAW